MLADKREGEYITRYAQILNGQMEDMLSKSNPARRYLVSVRVFKESFNLGRRKVMSKELIYLVSVALVVELAGGKAGAMRVVSKKDRRI